MSQTPSLKNGTIISVKTLLSEPHLRIPPYQRPYKWGKHNIARLFNDIRTQCDKPAYRLGTVVLHNSTDDEGEPVLDIVDGQQRTLTLMLIILAVNQYYATDEPSKDDRKIVENILGDLPDVLETLASKQTFASDLSVFNLHSNFHDILRTISRHELTPSHIDFLLNQCEVVVFILKDASEAFQFFDSQNSRGKSLYPHDLLKAFHLREFSKDDERLHPDIKAKAVAHWESLEDDKLHNLFSQHLFRIRRWINQQPARNFTNRDIDTFKGMSLHKDDIPPYAQAMQVVHCFVDDYNDNMHRRIDGQSMLYPFQLDQKLINGRRFFEMVEYYDTLVSHISKVHSPVNDKIKKQKSVKTKALPPTLLSKIPRFSDLTPKAQLILQTLATYPKQTRQGDRYTRNLFDNVLIYYIDKFGTADISLIIEIAFVWAYKMRLEHYAVKLATMDNCGVNGVLFKRITQATLPKDVWIKGVSPLKTTAIDNLPDKKSNSHDIYQLFKKLQHVNAN